MERRTAVIVGLSGVLLFGLARMLQMRAQKNAKYERNQRRVDVASEDSFPASDPPSWTPVQSTAAVAH
jgi:hypothetical protein